MSQNITFGIVYFIITLVLMLCTVYSEPWFGIHPIPTGIVSFCVWALLIQGIGDGLDVMGNDNAGS